MESTTIENNIFIELLLALIKFDYGTTGFYYNELGDFIILSKKYNKFNILLKNFTFKNVCDERYYLEILLPIQRAIDKKIISSIDSELLYVSNDYNILEILKKNRTWIKEMRNFIADYFKYITDLKQYINDMNNNLEIENKKRIIDIEHELFEFKYNIKMKR